MAMIKHERWTSKNGDKFVILPVEEYRRLEELAEDAGLSGIMRELKKRQANSPRIPLAQIKRELGLSRIRKKVGA